ncbi:hypothetical protein RhiJN_24579 [Ceratobasidium sp. AG-Ba]|nr:hypothetical protein RhiJN_24579 [Ceratobasidium sp. AG-Ba]
MPQRSAWHHIRDRIAANNVSGYTAIKLEPQPSKYDTVAEIYVDGKKVRKLPRIDKGRVLEWRDLYLTCDVNEGSSITLNVTEVHPFKDRTGSGTYKVSQTTNPDTMTIVCTTEGGKDMFTAHIELLGEEATKQAFSDALAKTKEKKPQVSSGRSGATREAFKKIIALSERICELDPSGGAKVAFSVGIKAWECFDAQEKQNTMLCDLVENVAGTISTIESVKSIADANLSETVAEMTKLVEDVSTLILVEPPRGRSERALYNIFNSTAQDRVEVLTKRCERLRKEFLERIAVQNLHAEKERRLRDNLKELDPVKFAAYNPGQQCLSHTRVTIIEALTIWAQGQDEQRRVTWLYGLAGLGKSSVATSVCMRLHAQGLLACSFFCKRDNPELRDPCRVLTTMVCELARHWPAYGAIVSEVICKNVGLRSKHMQPLFEILVDEPMKRLAKPEYPEGTLVIVLDALDECGDTTTRRQLLLCLQNISQLAPFLRVIITSRPDEDIRAYFKEAESDWYLEFDLLQYDASADIRLFVEKTLGQITIKGWPPDAVDRVTILAGGLFIWARTACTHIVAGLDKPKRLRTLTERSRLGAIDMLYETILTTGETIGDEEDMKELRRCLGAIVVTSMRSALSVAGLAAVMGEDLSQEVIQGVVNRLAAVLYIDDALDGAIRISHPSFMEYLIDSTRSGGLCVNIDEQNMILAERCLDVMISGLRFNICGLETSHRLNRDVPELETRVQLAIGPGLNYGCIYWSSHLTGVSASTVKSLVDKFLHGLELMYWLEALSLLGKLGVAAQSLLEVEKWCTKEHMQDCCALANDTYRFVLAFFDPISTSTPHLYISALAMAPSESRISKRMRTHFSNLLIPMDVLDVYWTPCIRSISVGSAVHSVSVSPGGQWIVSGCEDGTVRIWDSRTGEAALAPLQGHLGPVKCIAFSHHGRHIISGSSDNEIRIRDTATGKPIFGPLRGHSADVNTLSCSQDGALIASGSDDETARLWSTATGESLSRFSMPLSRPVLSVAFSPDSRFIACGSADGAVRLWDIQSGSMVVGPLEGESMLCIAFSPDGQRILSKPSSTGIFIWDAATGKQIIPRLATSDTQSTSATISADAKLIALGHMRRKDILVQDIDTRKIVLGPLVGHSGYIKSVAFSPTDKSVVSGSADATIRIWDAASIFTNNPSGPIISIPSQDVSPNTRPWLSLGLSSDGRLVASSSSDRTFGVWDVDTGQVVLGPLRGHSDVVWALAFSPDDSLIATGSRDKTVCIWEARSGSLVHEPLQSDSSFVKTVAFSPNGELLASGSIEGSIYIWNIRTGKLAIEPLIGHSSSVYDVVFSPDSQHLASGSDDDTLRIWSIATGATVFGPLEGHSSTVLKVSYSLDGLRVASGSRDGTVRIWDAQTGYLVSSTRGPSSGMVHSIAFSRDNRYIVAGLEAGRFSIWNVTTGHIVSECLSHSKAPLSHVVVDPNDRRIVTSGGDGNIRMWDATSYLRPELASRRLPDTSITALPEHLAGERLVVPVGQLARHLSASLDGWVTTADDKLLMWLPHELRQVDDSYMRISVSGSRRPRVDFTDFVRGEEWILVRNE